MNAHGGGDVGIRRAVAAYAGLLRMLPSAFRRRHGDEMLALFRDLTVEARSRAGTLGMLRSAIRESADLIVTAAKLHAASLGRSRPAATTAGVSISAGPMSHLSHGSSDMESLRQDLGYAVRAIAHRPGFTIVAAITLGLGIGATTAIFSVVNSVILRPLPYPEPERITMVWTTNPSSNWTRAPHSYPNYKDLRASATSFEAVAAYAPARAATILDGSEPALHFGVQASASLFRVLGVAPAEGRVFADSEEEAGASPVIVLGHALAARLSRGSGSMVGRTVTIDRVPHSVVGVMPADFAFPSTRAEYWAPLMPAGDFADRDTQWLSVIGRLRPGVELAAAQTEVAGIVARLAREHSAENSAENGVFLEQRQAFVTGDVKPALMMMLGAVAFVLAIACANLANLMLVRGSTRRRELAVRMALGANRSRLVRQLLTESILLALLGGVLGVGIAVVGTKLLAQFGPAALPRKSEIGVDGVTLMFTAIIAIVSGLVAGFFPAFRFSRPDLQGDLKGGVQGTTRGGRHNLQRGLVVVQMALALVLLVGAGLLTNSLLRLMSVDPGFDPRNVLTVRLAPPPDRYTKPGEIDALYGRLLERVQALPGAGTVGAAWATPFGSNGGTTGIMIEGQEVPASGRPLISMLPVRGDYFAAMKIRLIEGRTVTDADRAGDPVVLTINEGMAKRFWPGQSAVGKRIRRGTPEENLPWQTIVGVVADVKEELDTLPGLQGYWSHAQAGWARDMTVVLRTSGDPSLLMNSIRAEVRAIDPEMPIVSTGTMQEYVAQSVSEPRFRTVVGLSFAGVASLLALVGIYGVMAFVVAERTREIGLRMALGAAEGSVLRHVLGQGLRLTLIGIGIGVVGAVAATRVIRAMLFGVGATDPLTYAVVAAALGTVALLACYLPARRASRVDPIVALRAD